MASWSELPRELLSDIVERLISHTDFLHFGWVCTSWRSVAVENHGRLPRGGLPLSRCLPRGHPLPLLMLPCNELKETRDFFCIHERKVYNDFFLPETNKKWIPGSCKGWLVTVDLCSPEMCLFNPFTRAQIPLPPVTSFTLRSGQRVPKESRRTYHLIIKAILSSDPTSHPGDCVVLVIFGYEKIASFCRPGDAEWTNLKRGPTSIDDVIWYKERFYAVTYHGSVIAFDAGLDPQLTVVVGPPMSGIYSRSKRYLVECSGKLLQVQRQKAFDNDEDERFMNLTTYRTRRFEAFKLVDKAGSEEAEHSHTTHVAYTTSEFEQVWVEESAFKWVELWTLGDQMLFLGDNCSMSLPASSFPSLKGYIYFTDDDLDGKYMRLLPPDELDDIAVEDVGVCHDMGRYALTSASAVRFYYPIGPDFPTPPIWVTPNPW